MRLVLALLLGSAGCVPVTPFDGTLVDAPAILAIRTEPAEARPNAAVVLEALVAGPDGDEPGPVGWSWCTAARGADERTAVSARCLGGSGLEETTATTAVLQDACSLFGPIPPPVQGDAAPRRPSDPDVTGGYHLPVHAAAAGTEAFGAQRIRCDLAGATRDVFDAWQDRYTDNVNPLLVSLDVPATVAPGERVDLVVTTDAPEPYVVYVAERSVLVDRTETLTVRWYATGGTLADSRSTAKRQEARTRWTAPEDGPVHLWAVLQDDRGGTDWVSVTVEVR